MPQGGKDAGAAMFKHYLTRIWVVNKLLLILALVGVSSLLWAEEPQELDSATQRENPTTRVPYETGRPTASEREERWSDFLPIWGQAAREKGYVLPLPFGISAGYMHQDQPFDVNSIEINGVDFKEAGLVLVDQVQNEEGTYTLRFDTWVFPFFNVYGILGKTEGRAQGPISLDYTPIVQELANVAAQEANDLLCWRPSDRCPIEAPIIPSQPTLDSQIDLNYKGDVYGGGMTIAGGYKDFFGMIDMNKTYTNLDISSVDAKAIVTSARLGWNGKLGIFEGSLWLGAMHQDINQTLDLKLDLPADLGFIESISIDQSTAEPVNGVIGGRWTFTEEFEALLEFGVGQRQSVLISGSYRF